jgi:hypothetical protein
MNMNLDERSRRRVDEATVADVLRCIGAPPNKRARPKAGDLVGRYDFWFDGGAAKIETGYIEYSFVSGMRATVRAPIPALSVRIDLPNGCRVTVQQEGWGENTADQWSGEIR